MQQKNLKLIYYIRLT